MTDLSQNWSTSWAWGLPLVLFTISLYSFGLIWISERLSSIMRLLRNPRRRRTGCLTLVIAATVLAVTVLHGLEGPTWAASYMMLGALPDWHIAMLYSLSAMTTYGHEEATLASHWRMMGALEAPNGMILFSLTTAFPFAGFQKAWIVLGGRSRAE
jgi:hypothetical protein